MGQNTHEYDNLLNYLMTMNKQVKVHANLAASASMSISGNGVVQVKAADIVKSKSGVRQIAALKKIKSAAKVRHKKIA